MMQNARKLPKDWRWVKLKDICAIYSGGTPSKIKDEYWNGSIPFLTGADITSFFVDASNARAFLNEEGCNSGKTFSCEPGTVLLVTRTRVGRAGIVKQRMTVSQDISPLICGESIFSEYLCHYFKNISQNLIDNCRGATIQGLTKDFVSNLLIPLPPLPEQKRIAKILSQQLEAVEKARKAAQEQIQAAKALPAAYLRQVFESEEAKKWKIAKLGLHATKIGSGITPSGGQATYLTSGVPLIRSQNVLLNSFTKEGLACISPEQDALMENSRVLPGDVLLNITGASIGRVCEVPIDLCPANVNQHVSIIRTMASVFPAYLTLYLSSPKFQKFIWDNQAGATRQALTKSMIENFDVPLPDMAIQKKIAYETKERFLHTEQLIGQVQDRLKNIAYLPATLLRKAFQGEL